MESILVTFDVLNDDILRDVNFEQLLNTPDISVTFDVSNPIKLSEVKLLHPLNIEEILVKENDMLEYNQKIMKLG